MNLYIFFTLSPLDCGLFYVYNKSIRKSMESIMFMLSVLIGLVGFYLLSYLHHVDEVRRHMLQNELEAREEDFFRTEDYIKQLHSKGCVFNHQGE